MQINTVRAINDLSYWRITVTNGPVPNTNVEVEFTLPVEFSISSDTIVPVGTLVGTTWTIGSMTAGQVYSADIILKFDGPLPGISEEFEIEAVVTGTGDTNSSNNTKTDTILFEILSCDPFASGSSCEAGLKFDLSECSTPCTQGATPVWEIVADSEVNVNIIDFDTATGIGYYEFIDPSIPGSFTWGLSCVLGEDTIEICSTYTMTLHPLIDDKDVFDHSANFVDGSTLTPEQVDLLQAQSAYSGLTDEQIQALCWEVIYNADGDMVGGWGHDCTGEQDNRHFVFCSEVECEESENPCPSCPYTDMPADVSDYLDSITNYTPENGDVITVYHPGAISVYEYNGTAWVRSSCGCITFLNNPYPTSVTVEEDPEDPTMKILTITMSSGDPLTASYTDTDTNTTYTIVIAEVSGIKYLRLLDNTGTTVSSVMLPDATGECCCDCVFNLIPILDGATASTNCDIIWTGETANAIWESRLSDGDEGDWATLDTGYFDTTYDNGCTNCLIRVRYTIDDCEKFSNVVEVKNCGCWAELVYNNDALEIEEHFQRVPYIAYEGCGTVDWNDAEWQVRTERFVWQTFQTGGNASSVTVIQDFDPPIVVEEGYEGDGQDTLGNPYLLRVKYTENGCTKYTNTLTLIGAVP